MVHPIGKEPRQKCWALCAHELRGRSLICGQETEHLAHGRSTNSILRQNGYGPHCPLFSSLPSVQNRPLWPPPAVPVRDER